MKVLIVYASTEGQTQKIATELLNFIKSETTSCDLLNAGDGFRLPVGSYDAFVLAASIHHSEHQSSMFHFIQDNKDLLNQKPCCFLSVSLSAALPDALHQQEAKSYLNTFLEHTGLQPRMSLCVAGALRYQEMDYFRRELARTILLRTMGTTDVDLSRDYEFTDYEEVYSLIETFLPVPTIKQDVDESTDI